MALAEGNTPHPPLECIFTKEEETGLVGAANFDGSLVNARRLINVDSEEGVGEITIQSAGAQRFEGKLPLERHSIVIPGQQVLEVRLAGLPGGHSGLNINEKRGNSLILLGNLLRRAAEQIPSLLLLNLEGGNAMNAIPKEATAVIALPPDKIELFYTVVNAIKEDPQFRDIEAAEGVAPEISIDRIRTHSEDVPGFLTQIYRDKILTLLTDLPNGVIRMSPQIPNLVQTSSNLGVATTEKDVFKLEGLARSSVDTAQNEVIEQIRAVMEREGMKFIPHAGYSGWEADPNSQLLRVAQQVSIALSGQGLTEKRYHAGLETGVLNRHLGGQADMVSTGPKIHGAHSPQEAVSILSVEEWWRFFVAYVEEIAKAE